MSSDTPGVRLKKLIKRNGLNQKEFAEKFNLKYGYSDSEATISQYVNNKRTPEIDKMVKIADFFNTSLDYLMCRTTDDYAKSADFTINVFSKKLKELRLHKKLTQEELAKQLNQRYNLNESKATISQFENNKRIPDFERIINIADFFQVNLDYFIDTKKDNSDINDTNSNIRICKTKTHFPSRLKSLRKNINLSQLELAKIFNVSNGTISKWEQGEREPDFFTLLMIANYFGVSCDYLLGKENNNDCDSFDKALDLFVTQKSVIEYMKLNTDTLDNNKLEILKLDIRDILKIVSRKHKK